MHQPHDHIPTVVIHDQRRLRINWATAGAYITAALGLGIAIAVTGIDNALATLTPYNKICSQDLTSPNGPAAFYFPAPIGNRSAMSPGRLLAFVGPLGIVVVAVTGAAP